MPEQDRIRILIVDDIADTRENIRRMTQFDANIEVIGMPQSGQESIKLAAQLKPDVILMDINMPDMDGITATEIIRKANPFIQVIILSVQSDPSYMRRAMLAGARDFLTKPPMIDELTSAIRRAGVMAHQERAKLSQQALTPGMAGSPVAGGSPLGGHGKLVVVYSPKGGTGCTTVATNLAVALKSDGSRVLLVDASMQFGDVPVFLNEQIKNSLIDLTPRVDELDPEVVENVLLTHPGSGLEILAAPAKPEMAYHINAEQFGKLLEYLRRMFAYVVVDTSTYLTDSVQSALDAADLIVLLTTQEIPAIKNANLFLSLADASGIKRDRVLFVMNRYDRHIALTPERVGESLRQEVVLSIPLEEKIVANSVNRGVPFVHENKTLPISKLFFNLADLIRQRIAQAEEGKLETIGKK